MESKPKARILIVDDELIVRKSLASWFQEEGYSVDVAESGKQTLEKLVENDWDIFLLDIKMPGMDGLELQRRIKEIHPEASVIIMTAYASVETAVEAMKQGAYDYIVKPFEPDDLEHMVRNATERKQLMTANSQLRDKIEEMSPYHGIVGKSQAIHRVLEEIRLVAESDTTVLIRGESGTGKEVVARAIHATSLRRYMPIVVVNCGALAEGVLESELFGHEKGAFTGAHYRRKGKLEMADGGTLFLDEIGDIGLKTQVDLLRVLEEKKICRVGGNTYIPVDFRLVTATNKNLEEMVSEGTFREDFYYRLNVYSISIPPLRQRTEDVPLLVDHFLRRFSNSMNKPVPSVSKEAMGLLLAHDWPGNVRELQNAMERAVLISQSGEIGPEALPFYSNSSRPAGSGKSLAEAESVHIHKVLEESEWNISRAARMLQIDRVTLYNKMKRYGLRRDQ
ncbi:MAG: sigma-54-dependent Fis family transcriptional regulator [Acidobacteria bacterium]|nr:MAG: sigma-54-dependent Fis family transcriptional regulator [Acidobacteriota bacterium]